MTDTPDHDSARLTIAQFAAFSDGAKHEQKREEIRRIVDSQSNSLSGPDAPGLVKGSRA